MNCAEQPAQILAHVPSGADGAKAKDVASRRDATAGQLLVVVWQELPQPALPTSQLSARIKEVALKT